MNNYIVSSGKKSMTIQAGHSLDALFIGAQVLGYQGKRLKVVCVGKVPRESVKFKH